MPHTIKVRQFDRTFETKAGQTILEAALVAGLDYPFGCRSGNCGACKSALLSGDVKLRFHSSFVLKPEEKDRGLILACRAEPKSDCEVAFLYAEEVVAHPNRVLACTVSSVMDATHDIRVIGLNIDSGEPFAFSAGQYASLTFDGQPPRDFSMANRPGLSQIEFHIRQIAEGTVSGHVKDTLKIGDRVRVEGPLGVSFLRDSFDGPMLAIAGSSGLAPIKSIVETAVAFGMEQPLHVYFGARQEQDLYLIEYFAKLAAAHDNVAFTPVLSEPAGPTEFRTGLVGAVAAADHAELTGWKAYVAGPPAMVESTIDLLVARGLRRPDCHADAFYTEAEKATC